MSMGLRAWTLAPHIMNCYKISGTACSVALESSSARLHERKCPDMSMDIASRIGKIKLMLFTLCFADRKLSPPRQ